MSMIITWLIGKFAAAGLPEPVRKIAAYATLVVVVAGVLWGAKAAYDASVVEDHENKRAIESIDARDKSAEERADDIIKHTIEEKEAQDAIKSVPGADAQLRLDCLRLQRAGIDAEPCRRFGSD